MEDTGYFLAAVMYALVLALAYYLGKKQAYEEIEKELEKQLEGMQQQRPPVPGVYSPEQLEGGTLKPLFNEERSLFQKRRAIDLQLRELPIDNDGYRVKKSELLKVDEQIKQVRAKINKHVLADIQSTP